MTNNAAERALRGVAVGRHNWTFAGSDRGGERAAAIYTLIETAKLNIVDPQAWLADVLARLPDHPEGPARLDLLDRDTRLQALRERFTQGLHDPGADRYPGLAGRGRHRLARRLVDAADRPALGHPAAAPGRDRRAATGAANPCPDRDGDGPGPAGR